MLQQEDSSELRDRPELDTKAGAHVSSISLVPITVEKRFLQCIKYLVAVFCYGLPRSLSQPLVFLRFVYPLQ